jgi:hypothetical protein
MDGWRKNFLCLACRHAYTYRVEDVRWESQEKQEGWEHEKAVVYFSFLCGQHNCPARIKLFIVVDNDDIANGGVSQQLAGVWELSGVLCRNNHLARCDGSENPGRLHLDPSWLEPEK